MTPSAHTAGGRRVARWTREEIIEKIREWNDRYGEPPCSADWNPSLARWRAQDWRVERYRDGSWPSTNAAKRPFDGSFDAAVRAAGLEPHRPGPRRRGPGEARPPIPAADAWLGPDPPAEAVAATPDTAGAAASDHARAASDGPLERRLAVAERRAARAEAQVGEARRRARRAAEQAGRARRARDRVRVAERDARAEAAERIEELVADADARVRAAIDQSEAATRDAFEERRARRAAEARAEAAGARAETAERLARLARAELATLAASEADDDAAWKAARAAEARAAEAEREARELAEALCGEHRRLTADELAELRADGPSGPAVLAGALRRLARARASNDRAGLAAALSDVAAAAVRWRDRL